MYIIRVCVHVCVCVYLKYFYLCDFRKGCSYKEKKNENKLACELIWHY